jgi:hypothetical protein
VTKLVAALHTLFLLAACSGPARLDSANGRAYELSLAYVGGRPAVAWYGGSTPHQALFIRYASNAGKPANQVLQLTDGARDAYEPSLQDIDGDALVAWYEQAVEPGTGTKRQSALLARFDAQGRQRWRMQLSSGETNGRIPVVRVRDGLVHVAWIEQRNDTDVMLRVASLDANGQWLQGPRDAARVGGNTWNLNAAIGADGSFHVLYDSGQGGTAKELHWLRVHDGQVDDRRISTDDGIESAYPDIALDGARAAITWFDARHGNAEVYLRCVRLDAAGAPPANLQLDDGAARRVTRSPGDSIGAYVAWNDGHIELAWTEINGDRRRLLLRRFDGDCKPKAAAQQIGGRYGAAGIASLASSQFGFALAWDEQRRDSSSLVLLRAWLVRAAK